jgi:hypothetical protein
MPTRLTSAARTPRVMERHVQEAVTQFLQLDDWRHLRTDPVSDRGRGKGFGEIGMCDALFIRYAESGMMIDITKGCSRKAPVAEVLWCEFKAPGKKPRPEQIAWHEAERARGGFVLVVDDFDTFRRNYIDNGFARKIRADRKTA